MKSFVAVIICAFVLAAPAMAQKSKTQPVVVPDLPVDSETGLYSYIKVVEIPGVNKDELYKRAFAWANTFYKNPGDVIREKNPEEGKMLIKARFKISNEPDKKGLATAAGDVMYSLSLGLKEGKYRYEITKINWQQTSVFPIERWKDTASPSYNSSYPYYLKQTDEKIKEVIASLEKYMKAESKEKKDDW
ncbi:MAG TPA: DUF4468 domain-containing protein [Bacteroidia bacterium]|nr:DUF4468 domain-containing protein [Bacteroidia bacterium]